jgi:hypothetical protein
MEQAEPTDYVVATYDEIRLRFGLGGTDQARMKAKRRKWPAEPRNHPGAVARIRVPREDWDAVIDGDRSRGTVPPDPDQSHKNNPLIDAAAAFREVEARLRAELDAARARGDLAEATVARQMAELVAQAERMGRAEAEAAAAREAVARELRQAEQAEEARKVAETRRRAAEAAREATQAELAAWTAGGPLARTWRAFWNQQGRL